MKFLERLFDKPRKQVRMFVGEYDERSGKFRHAVSFTIKTKLDTPNVGDSVLVKIPKYMGYHEFSGTMVDGKVVGRSFIYEHDVLELRVALRPKYFEKAQR